MSEGDERGFGWGLDEPGVGCSDLSASREPPLLEARAVEREYGVGGVATVALRGVTLGVERGEFLGIMGPSGSGKSTLLNCLDGIDSPTSGVVCLGGRDLSEFSERQLAKLRRERFGFVFQESNLIESLDAFENIGMPLAISGWPRQKADARVLEVAKGMQIGSFLYRYPHQLSRGQRQRVAMARAIAGRPEVLFADEPTGALDSYSSMRMLALLSQVNRSRGTTVLMVTHDESAASYCSRVLFLRDGRVFSELSRGSSSRREFFSRILGIVSMFGGEGSAL